MKLLYKISPLLFLILILLLWEFLPRILGTPIYVFPTISTIFQSMAAISDTLLTNALTTIREAILGFLLGSFIGFVTGVIMAESKFLERIILPYVVGSNAIPAVALAPLIVLWFGHGIESKVILVAFLCFFPLSINTFRGLCEYPAIYQELFFTYGAKKSEFLLKFKMRNALPYIFSGLKLNATYSVVGAIVAEFVGSTAGLGFGMLQATYNINTPRLFGYIIVACFLGLSMYYSMLLLEKYILKTKNKK